MLYSVDEKYPVAAACPYICPLLSAASLLSHPPASFPPLARAHTHTRARARSYNNFDFAVTKCSARSDWSKRLKKITGGARLDWLTVDDDAWGNGWYKIELWSIYYLL